MEDYNKWTNVESIPLKRTHSLFCGPTGTPVLDFPRHLPWLSKPQRISLLACFVACMILRFTFGATPVGLFDGKHCSEAFLTNVLGTCIHKCTAAPCYSHFGYFGSARNWNLHFSGQGKCREFYPYYSVATLFFLSEYEGFFSWFFFFFAEL